MKKTFITIIALCCLSTSHAQQNTVEVSYEWNERDNSYTFFATSISHLPYTVYLTFTDLANTIYSSTGKELPFLVQQGTSRLLTLRSQNPKESIRFRYSHRYIQGDATKEIDTNFVYLLPLAPGKTTRITTMGILKVGKYLNDSTTVTGLTFSTTSGDTIYAARGGMVGNVVYRAGESDNISRAHEQKIYDRKNNFLTVYHKDGSIAKYILFKDNGIFVKEGERITAGQPLGIIAGDEYTAGSHLRFVLTHPGQLIPDPEDPGSQTMKIFIPVFRLSENQTGIPEKKGSYQVVHDNETITQEMTKRDKKRKSL